MVSDNGPGLPVGSEQKIFERFYRHTNGADAARGSGLGLAICKAIIDLHQGKIVARNRPEGGAEFAFTIPNAEPQPSLALL